MTGSRKYNFKCQSFPNTIEQERRRRGWTVTKLAELSGVSRYSIAAYETWAAGGIVPKQQMKSVTDTTAQMIADALEVTPEQLFKHYAEAAAEHKPRVKPFSTRYEAYFPLHDPASSYRFEDRYELREECREAVRTLSPERRRDPYIAELLEAVAL